MIESGPKVDGEEMAMYGLDPTDPSDVHKWVAEAPSEDAVVDYTNDPYEIGSAQD